MQTKSAIQELAPSPQMKSLPPKPPNGLGGPLPPKPPPPPGKRGPPRRSLGGPAPGPMGSYRAPGGTLRVDSLANIVEDICQVGVAGTYCPLYPAPPPPRPPNIGSSKVGCIPPPPGPKPPPLSGSCGPSPGGYKSLSPMFSGLRSPPIPPLGLLISYSSSKPGGGKSPAGYGLRGSAANGSLNGRGWAGGGNRSSRRGSYAGWPSPSRPGPGCLGPPCSRCDGFGLAECAESSYPSLLRPGASFCMICSFSSDAASVIRPADIKIFRNDKVASFMPSDGGDVYGSDDGETKSFTRRSRVCSLSSPIPRPLITALFPRRLTLTRYSNEDWVCA